jgi:NAD(P)-dependent dehydrogenase (short-subunit alcohol dehydrogenase family)
MKSHCVWLARGTAAGCCPAITKAVAFLASSDASYITGIELAVDGDLTQL